MSATFKTEDLSILVGESIALPNKRIHRELEALLYSDERDGKQTAPAVFQDDKTLTFLELDQASNRLARYLIPIIVKATRADKANPLVGIMMEPSIDRFIVTLAIWKTGAAYVPLDPSFPAERTRYMMNTSGLDITVADSVPTFMDQDEYLLVKDILENSQTYPEDILEDEEEIKDTDKTTSALLAMFFTSGTTGMPKAVPISHRNVLSAVQNTYGAPSKFPIQDDDIMAQFFNHMSIASPVEIVSCLLHLIPIVVIPNSAKMNPVIFIQIVEKFRITKLLAVAPTFLKNLMVFLGMKEYEGCCRSLKVIGLGSEIVSSQLIKDSLEFFKYKTKIVQVWGMTETTMLTITETFVNQSDLEDKIWKGKASLGTPGYNSVVYIVDHDFHPVQMGEVGQIAITGSIVSSGYMNDIGGSFIQNHLEPLAGSTLFLTGDYGCIRKGRVYFEGRDQTRVKIKGYRVSTLEIEEIIKGIPEVHLAAVIGYIPKESQGDETTLAAYYTKRPNDSITPDDVKRRCRGILPHYAIPFVFQLDEMPIRLPQGKINYPVLHDMFAHYIHETATVFEQDKDKTFDQDSLVAVVAKQLKMLPGDVSLEANLFDLGGDSQTATKIWSALKEMGYTETLSNFLSANTLSDLLHNGEDPTRKYEPCQEFLIEDFSKLSESDVLEALNICVEFRHNNPNPLYRQTRPFSKAEIQEDLERVFHSALCEEVKHHDASFVIKDTRNHIATVVLLRDPGICCSHSQATSGTSNREENFSSTKPSPTPARWKALMDAMNHGFLLEQERSGTKVGNGILFAVPRSLPNRDRSKLHILVMQKIKDKASEKDWKFVYANTIIPSAKEMMIENGARICNKVHVASFETDEGCPFAHAPDDVFSWMLVFDI